MTSERRPLFEYLSVLAVAMGRGKVTRQQASIAMFVALSTHGTTGEGGTIDADRLQLELGLGERQIWRHFKALRDAGWVEQTTKPTRGGAGEAGRRARYRLTIPSLDLSDDSTFDRLTEQHATMTDDPAQTPESSVTSPPNRLSLPVESSDIAEREDGTVSPSDGSPSDGSTAAPSPALTTGRARERCAEYGHTDDAGHCRQCASERLASGRPLIVHPPAPAASEAAS